MSTFLLIVCGGSLRIWPFQVVKLRNHLSLLLDLLLLNDRRGWQVGHRVSPSITICHIFLLNLFTVIVNIKGIVCVHSHRMLKLLPKLLHCWWYKNQGGRLLLHRWFRLLFHPAHSTSIHCWASLLGTFQRDMIWPLRISTPLQGPTAPLVVDHVTRINLKVKVFDPLLGGFKFGKLEHDCLEDELMEHKGAWDESQSRFWREIYTAFHVGLFRWKLTFFVLDCIE